VLLCCSKVYRMLQLTAFLLALAMTTINAQDCKSALDSCLGKTPSPNQGSNNHAQEEDARNACFQSAGCVNPSCLTNAVHASCPSQGGGGRGEGRHGHGHRGGQNGLSQLCPQGVDTSQNGQLSQCLRNTRGQGGHGQGQGGRGQWRGNRGGSGGFSQANQGCFSTFQTCREAQQQQRCQCIQNNQATIQQQIGQCFSAVGIPNPGSQHTGQECNQQQGGGQEGGGHHWGQQGGNSNWGQQGGNPNWGEQQGGNPNGGQQGGNPNWGEQQGGNPNWGQQQGGNPNGGQQGGNPNWGQPGS